MFFAETKMSPQATVRDCTAEVNDDVRRDRWLAVGQRRLPRHATRVHVGDRSSRRPMTQAAIAAPPSDVGASQESITLDRVTSGTASEWSSAVASPPSFSAVLQAAAIGRTHIDEVGALRRGDGTWWVAARHQRVTPNRRRCRRCHGHSASGPWTGLWP